MSSPHPSLRGSLEARVESLLLGLKVLDASLKRFASLREAILLLLGLIRVVFSTAVAKEFLLRCRLFRHLLLLFTKVLVGPRKALIVELLVLSDLVLAGFQVLPLRGLILLDQIGRASCRERVSSPV